MKFKALIAALLIGLGSGVWAQGQPLACQEDASAGLDWKNGRWESKRFTTSKFILVVDGPKIREESLIKATGLGSGWNCEVLFEGRNLCRNLRGSVTLYFSPITNRGGITYMHGAIDDDKTRDSISVSAFTCVPF